MVIGIIGESCTGKSTLADQLKRALQAQVFTGKDYLRLAKGEALAQNLFRKKLEEAAPDEHILYVVSEAEHLQLLPENATRILVTADLETIKERFARRMRGNMARPRRRDARRGSTGALTAWRTTSTSSRGNLIRTRCAPSSSG